MAHVPFDLLLHQNKISEAVYISAAHSIAIKPKIQLRQGVRYVPEDEAAEIIAVVKGLERPSNLADTWKALLTGAIGGAAGNLLSSPLEGDKPSKVVDIDASLSPDRASLDQVLHDADPRARVVSMLSFLRQTRDLGISEKMLCQRIADEGYQALYDPLHRPAFYFSAEFRNSIRIVEEATRGPLSTTTAKVALTICYSKAFHATAFEAFAGGGLSSNEIQLLMKLKSDPVHRHDKAFE